MDMNIVGSVMSNHAKVSTLEAVNVDLLKTTNEQTEQQAVQLLESVSPRESTDGKGKYIDIHV